jgi:hypothetical protein
MNNFIVVILLFLVSAFTFGQSYKGPAAGSVSSGVSVSTTSFSKAAPVIQPEEKKVRNILRYKSEPQYVDFGQDIRVKETMYFEDPAIKKEPADINNSILIQEWSGIAQTNSIPPDPYVAVGPAHIIATVNSRFAIWDKEGNLINNISADTWFGTALPGVSSFDPKVLYDHFSKRWIMVWLHQNDNLKDSYYLVSVSDDSIPTGTWYNWALPSYRNGNDSTTYWGDYEGVGFDDKALYITSNQFQFEGSFQYVKIRIIPKSELYANTAGLLSWKDLWDIRYPTNSGKVFNIRPSIPYTVSDTYYLLHSPGGGGNFMTLYKITDPLGTPKLSGSNIPVAQSAEAPNADQLDGSTMLIEGGGNVLRQEITYRDGYVWGVHTIATPGNSKYSSIRYVKIDVSTNKAVEDQSFGAAGFWHYYPALAVDKDQNIAITYSRSGETEYAGAYYTGKLKNETGFQGSKTLQAGKANYVKDFDSGRNRWGDYNGIWVDPSDENNFWVFTEFVSARNTWNTWVGNIRLIPFPGAHVKAGTKSLDFGSIEVNFQGDTLSVWIYNLGEDALTISDIPEASGPFSLVSGLSFPVSVASFDSLMLSFTFNPTSPGVYEVVYPFNSNDVEFSGITLSGRGFEINAAEENMIYVSSGTSNSGQIAVINSATGSAANIGSSLFSEIKSIDVHPQTKILYGIVSSESGTRLVRVNAAQGDAYHHIYIPVTGLVTIVFDNGGNLYAAQRTGELYKINMSTGEAALKCKIAANVAGLAFDPLTNDLWGSSYALVGSGKDVIFKVNIQTGDTTFIGKTGINLVANDIEFDASGILYGITGTTTQVNNFIIINTITGAGTTVGSTGLKNLTGLAIISTGVTSVADGSNKTIPSAYSLSQNFPNPFNPVTTIEYGIPVDSRIRLVIYNILGEVVAELVNSEVSAGIYRIDWNAANYSSGIYFYEMKAAGSNGNQSALLRKMILLK